MIIFILSVAALVCTYGAFHYGIRSKKAEEALIEKESIIDALQIHTKRVDFEMTKLNAELAYTLDQIKSLKSQTQSLIDKAKNKAKAEKAQKAQKEIKVEKKEAVAITAEPVKVKRKYNKKTV